MKEKFRDMKIEQKFQHFSNSNYQKKEYIEERNILRKRETEGEITEFLETEGKQAFSY